MIATVMMQRRGRVLLASSVFMSGMIIAILLSLCQSLTAVIALLPIGLAALVGYNKLASP